MYLINFGINGIHGLGPAYHWHSTLKRRAGYISFDPPSVQLLRLVYKIEFAPLYQSMKTKDQKLAEIKGLARRAAQRFFSVFIFLQFGGKNLLKKLCQ